MTGNSPYGPRSEERRATADGQAGAPHRTTDVALLDDLTGLYNRRFTSQLFSTSWADFVSRHAEIALVLIDLDGFKAINDTYGHSAGDEVLKSVASLLREHFREGDMVIRYGGDEFLVVLPDAGEAGAKAFARRAREAVAGHRYFAGEKTPIDLPLSFSVGVATYPTDGAEAADLLKTADRLLYDDKRLRSLRRRWNSRAFRRGLLAIVLLALLVFVGWALRSQVQPRPAVAVLGFKNLSGKADAAWLSTALEEMVSAELAASVELRLIPGEEVARARVDLGLPPSDSFARDTLVRVRSHLGADIVVMGSYLAADEEEGGLRLDVRLQSAVGGEGLGAITETGRTADLLSLVQRTGTALRERLGVAALDGGASRAALAAMPADLEATRRYSEGLSALRHFDALTAREHLEQAVARDPRSSLARSALADAWAVLGYDGRALEQAQRAFELAGNLPREERLVVEARLREAQRAWGAAADIYGRLFAFAPDNLDYGLSLARAQRMAGKSHELRATVAALRALPPPARDDARIDLAEAESSVELNDVIAAARRAVAKARSHGARLLTAKALLVAAFPLGESGDYDGALEAASEAKAIYEEAGDRGGVAQALNRMAQARPNDLLRAQALVAQALAISREIGDQRWTGQFLNNLALTYSNQGDLARARPLFDEALTLLESIGATRTLGLVFLNLGRDLNSAGRPAEARGYLRRALDIFRGVDDRRRVIYVLNNLGNSAQALGELDEAWRLYSESLTLTRGIGDRRIEAYTLFDLGEVLLLRGETQGASRRHSEGLIIRQALGLSTDAAESQLALARVALADGRLSQAEAEARLALSTFAVGKIRHNEAAARVELARALLAQNRLAEAEEVAAPALGIARSVQFTSVRLDLDILRATLRAKRGHLSVAMVALGRCIDEATRLGLAREAFEARLIQASLHRNTRRAAELVSAIAAEARQKGFVFPPGRVMAARAGTAASGAALKATN